jgi:hypothetical protein
MPRYDELSDETVEALLSGLIPDGDLAGSAAFVAGVKAAAGDAPAPSPTLAALLAAGGICTDKGDLPATAASNVHGPAPQVSGLPKWRNLSMHIKRYVAGLGLAAKVAMGAGIAAAATTGAGAAGVLPAPVQHAMATAVDAVTPFTLPKPFSPSKPFTLPKPPAPPVTTPPPGGADSGRRAGDGPFGPATTSTTAPAGEGHGPESTTPTQPPAGGGHETGTATPPPPPGGGDHGPQPAPTTTTTAPRPPGGEHHEPVTTTTSRPVQGDGPAPTTTTTAPPPAHTESSNPESISLSCLPAADAARVTCTWTKSAGADHATYALLRTTTGAPGRVVLQSPDAVTFADSSVAAGATYGYRVISLRPDGTVESHSNLVTVTVTVPGSHT